MFLNIPNRFECDCTGTLAVGEGRPTVNLNLT